MPARLIWSESSCFPPKGEKLNFGWRGSGKSRGGGWLTMLPIVVHIFQVHWSQGVNLSWAGERREPATWVTSRRVFVSRLCLLNGQTGENHRELNRVEGDAFAGIWTHGHEKCDPHISTFTSKKLIPELLAHSRSSSSGSVFLSLWLRPKRFTRTHDEEYVSTS